MLHLLGEMLYHGYTLIRVTSNWKMYTKQLRCNHKYTVQYYNKIPDVLYNSKGICTSDKNI